jgi:hypothetical protein
LLSFSEIFKSDAAKLAHEPGEEVGKIGEGRKDGDERE